RAVLLAGKSAQYTRCAGQDGVSHAPSPAAWRGLPEEGGWRGLAGEEWLERSAGEECWREVAGEGCLRESCLRELPEEGRHALGSGSGGLLFLPGQAAHRAHRVRLGGQLVGAVAQHSGKAQRQAAW